MPERFYIENLYNETLRNNNNNTNNNNNNPQHITVKPELKGTWIERNPVFIKRLPQS